MTKLAVVTSSRADYGILAGLIKRLDQDSQFEVEIIATGTHLSINHGMTINEIIADGFNVESKIYFETKSDEPFDLMAAVSDTQREFTHCLKRLKSECIIILGDRFEMLPLAYVAAMMGVKIIHLHGGEVTLGAIDNKIRYAISSLSDLHLVATELSKERLINAGFDRAKVVVTGALGVENSINFEKANRSEIEHKTGFKFQSKNILLTFHPETVSDLTFDDQIQIVLEALSGFPDEGKLITLPNTDPGNIIIKQYLENFKKNNVNTCIVDNLGHYLYLSAIKHVDVVVGNSSSGIIEAPALGTQTINIGSRQKGRETSSSIYECSYSIEEITRSIQKIFSQPKKIKLSDHPYYRKNTKEIIVSSIKEFMK